MRLLRLRRSLLTLALAVAAAALPVAAGAGSDRARLDLPEAGDLLAYRIDDSTVGTLPRSQGSWGGVYTTASGSRVEIEVSGSYVEDQTETQMWADYVDTLVHGPELGDVRIFFAPFREMQNVCGRGAAACYSPVSATIVVPGEDLVEGPSVEALLAHEYGHHVAASSVNPPWEAVVHGTKRWATNLGVCPLTNSGELVPGGEGADYTINPGEIFAESYRVLNQRRLGADESPWEIVSGRFYPDDRALQLLEQDVLQPWTSNTLVTVRGKAPRTVRVATPLDGTFRATVTAPRGTLYRVSAPKTVCGQRTVNVKLTRVKGKGAFTLRISRP